MSEFSNIVYDSSSVNTNDVWDDNAILKVCKIINYSIKFVF